ncbi:hypothetical protein E2C01_081650 [Portunus trituberculatus]|uniref:Uncharacterized protein n=1 Tax=Portunus trituberculatus TaxID=210409 RepID=A0A5B7J2V6_PORTR|nr:hypothetical protein [Portunus trituberculatus]
MVLKGVSHFDIITVRSFSVTPLSSLWFSPGGAGGVAGDLPLAGGGAGGMAEMTLAKSSNGGSLMGSLSSIPSIVVSSSPAISSSSSSSAVEKKTSEKIFGIKLHLRPFQTFPPLPLNSCLSLIPFPFLLPEHAFPAPATPTSILLFCPFKHPCLLVL